MTAANILFHSFRLGYPLAVITVYHSVLYNFFTKAQAFPEISNFFYFLYCRKRKHKKTAPVRNMVVRTGLSDIYLFLSEQGRKNSADDHRSCAYDQSADAKCDHNDSPFD